MARSRESRPFWVKLAQERLCLLLKRHLFQLFNHRLFFPTLAANRKQRFCSYEIHPVSLSRGHSVPLMGLKTEAKQLLPTLCGCVCVGSDKACTSGAETDGRTDGLVSRETVSHLSPSLNNHPFAFSDTPTPHLSTLSLQKQHMQGH